jgi:hypothetical protein
MKYKRKATLNRENDGTIVSIVGVIVIVFFLIAPSSIVLGAKYSGPPKICAPSASTTLPIVEQDSHGIPLAQEYFVPSRGIWFKVPFGYLDPWPSALAESLIRKYQPGVTVLEFPEKTSVSVAFWMPSLRWPEHDRSSVPSFRPCEQGRPVPASSEFIVEARISWPWIADGLESFVTPAVRTSNAIPYLKLLRDGEKHGLVRFRNSPANTRLTYSNLERDPNLQILIDCSPDVDPPPNPSCTGNVWFPKEKLGLWVHFSKQNLGAWKDIVAATRKLAYQWRT